MSSRSSLMRQSSGSLSLPPSFSSSRSVTSRHGIALLFGAGFKRKTAMRHENLANFRAGRGGRKTIAIVRQSLRRSVSQIRSPIRYISFYSSESCWTNDYLISKVNVVMIYAFSLLLLGTLLRARKRFDVWEAWNRISNSLENFAEPCRNPFSPLLSRKL